MSKLHDAIQNRYSGREWACFREVANATGAACKRHADFVAMGLWPSRGMEIIGIECKVSRSDWLSELRKPEKAEAVYQYCDRWYLAVSDASIVKAGELPPTWGLMVLEGGKLKITEGPKLTPAPLSKGFVASLLSLAADAIVKPGKEALEAERRAGWQEGHDWAKEHGAIVSDHDAKGIEALREQVEAFKKASGIDITRYSDGDDLGKLVSLLRIITSGDGLTSTFNALRVNAAKAAEIANKIVTVANAMETLVGARKGKVENGQN